jgi:hypothetical protein
MKVMVVRLVRKFKQRGERWMAELPGQSAFNHRL